MYVLLPVFLLVRLLAICFFVLYITVSMYMIVCVCVCVCVGVGVFYLTVHIAVECFFALSTFCKTLFPVYDGEKNNHK